MDTYRKNILMDYYIIIMAFTGGPRFFAFIMVY